MMEDFTITKKAVKKIVREFVYDKMDIFSNKKRGMNAIEDKVVDVLHQEVLKIPSMNYEEAKTSVEEIMQSVVELADTLGFTKIIYDFVLICTNNY